VNGCVFCEIAGGRVEASIVYEDDDTLAFMDLKPVNPGHVLVVPREHVPSVRDLDEELGGRVFKVAMRLESAIRNSGVRCEGTNMFVADGEAAFQDVFHFHLHVFPRFQGDRFTIDADWKEQSRAELDRVASDIRSAYEQLWR
jgi:histidine triad (HIT) family protein